MEIVPEGQEPAALCRRISYGFPLSAKLWFLITIKLTATFTLTEVQNNVTNLFIKMSEQMSSTILQHRVIQSSIIPRDCRLQERQVASGRSKARFGYSASGSLRPRRRTPFCVCRMTPCFHCVGTYCLKKHVMVLLENICN